MSFCLTIAPSTFIRLTNHALHAFIDRFLVVYFDDILLCSRSLDKRTDHVHYVLNLLGQEKLYGKLHGQSCVFFWICC